MPAASRRSSQTSDTRHDRPLRSRETQGSLALPRAPGRVPSGAFGEVRPGEAPTVLLLALNVFLLLTAYYLLKVAREPLILLGSGAEVKSYASVGQSVLLVFVASFYGWLSARVGRVALIASVTLFFAMNLGVFWALGTPRRSAGHPVLPVGRQSSTP